jgi:hypothetical protein
MSDTDDFSSENEEEHVDEEEYTEYCNNEG